jgi:hypothetical protein
MPDEQEKADKPINRDIQDIQDKTEKLYWVKQEDFNPDYPVHPC